ncbi:MAG: hypothetical protein VX527_10795 [Planctomycetota bacterium]|nr:hypothetical protein [Planctomycetota bacterium]
MPLLAVQKGHPILDHPDFGPAALLIVILLAVLGTLLIVLTLFWLNRRMKKVIGLPGSRQGSRRGGEDVDPWIEAGRRVDRDAVESLYEEDED